MTGPIINPATLTKEQREAIKAKYHEVRTINSCTNDLFADDTAIFNWLFGEDFFGKENMNGTIDNLNLNQCPFCKSYNYEVGDFTPAYNCRCKDCGASWWYNFTYTLRGE